MIRADGERGGARQEVRAGGITGSAATCAGHITWPTTSRSSHTFAVVTKRSRL